MTRSDSHEEPYMADSFEYEVSHVKKVTVLTLDENTANLVADALEIVRPDSDEAAEAAIRLAALLRTQ